MKMLIDKLHIAYDVDLRTRALLQGIIGEYPYRAEDDLLVELAQVFLESGDPKKTRRWVYLVAVGMPGQLVCDLNTFKYLRRTEPEKWPPVRCRYVPVVSLGQPLTTRLCVWDGGHRIALLLALGCEEVKVKITPFDEVDTGGTHVYGHSKPYQTLVFPHGVIEGMRATERWELLKPEDIVGKAIGDFGCNSGTDGIMALLCGAKSYHGFEKDERSVSYGRMMAGKWALTDKAKFSVGDLPSEVPEFDTLFLFSVAQRIPSDILLAAVACADPGVVYLETHASVDLVSSNLMAALKKYNWQKVGSVPQSSESQIEQRLLFRGVA